MKPHLGVLAAFVGLTVLFTWPLAAEFGRAVPGGGDAWQHLWNLWWMREALVTLHTDPFYTPLLYYPHGVSLLFHTLVPLESALTVPFQLAGVDLVPLYNGVLALSFVLAGYGTWLLVRDLTGHSGAAFVAGFAFAFCPYHLGHLLGHMNLASLQWIPLYLWALFRACGAPGSEPNPPAPFPRREGGGDEPNPPAPFPAREGGGARTVGQAAGWAALAGVFLAANAFTEWIYVAFLAVFTAGYMGWRLLVDARRPGQWRAWAPLLGRLLVLAVVFGGLAGPLLLATARAQQGQDWMKLPPSETLVYSSDLVDSFVPSAQHPLWPRLAQALERRMPARNPAERAVFLGYTPLAIGALVIGLRRRRATLFWGITAALAWLLSLGPVLHVLGRSSFTSFGASVPLPYLLLYSVVPGFSVMRVPARFVVLASLALAVLIGYALAGLAGAAETGRQEKHAPAGGAGVAAAAGGDSRRWGRAGAWLSRHPRVVQGAVFALIALEFLAVPYPMAPPGYHIPFYARIATEPGNFAILELPLRPMSDYLAYQTVHGHPLVYGYLSRQPPDPFVDNTPVLHYLLNTTPAAALPAPQAAAGAGVLQAAGIRYVVVHWWAFTAPEAEAMRAKLAAIFPTQTPEDDPADQMVIYRLGP